MKKGAKPSKYTQFLTTGYRHHLYALAAQPPFELVDVGPAFVFPPFFARGRLRGVKWMDMVQFGGGLALVGHLRRTLRFSYGVADCVGLTADVTLPLVSCTGIPDLEKRPRPRPADRRVIANANMTRHGRHRTSARLSL